MILIIFWINAVRYSKEHKADTRARIVRAASIRLREKGAQAGCIMTGERVDEAAAVKAARMFPGLKGVDIKALGIPSMDEYIAAYCKRTGCAGIPPSPSSASGSGASRVHRTTPSWRGSPDAMPSAY